MIKTNVLAINTITGKYLRASDGKIPVKYFLHCSEGFFIKLAKSRPFRRLSGEFIFFSSACEIIVAIHKIICDLITL